MLIRLLVPLVLVAATVVGCGEHGDSAITTGTPASKAELRLAFGPPESESCKPPNVKKAVIRFLDSASTGDRSGLGASLTQGPAFRQFSAGFDYGSGRAEHFFATRERRLVIAKLLQRQALGDRYSLRTIDLNGYERSRHLCNLAFTLSRRIGNGPRRPFIGKGALDARTRTVSVWNVGGEIRR